MAEIGNRIGRSVFNKKVLASDAPELVQAVLEHDGEIIAIVSIRDDRYREVWWALGSKFDVTHRSDTNDSILTAYKEKLIDG